MLSLLFDPLPLVAAIPFCIAALVAAEKPPAARKTGGDKPGEKSTANYNIPLWDEGKVPLATGNGPLDSPFLTVFLPPEGKRNGGSVIIAPGGSNIMLMYGVEGIDVAERYNSWGVTAFVLTYRMSPRYGENVRVMEGKRAVQLVRCARRRIQAGPEPRRLHRVLRRLKHGAQRGGHFRPGRSQCGRSRSIA